MAERYTFRLQACLVALQFPIKRRIVSSEAGQADPLALLEVRHTQIKSFVYVKTKTFVYVKQGRRKHFKLGGAQHFKGTFAARRALQIP